MNEILAVKSEFVGQINNIHYGKVSQGNRSEQPFETLLSQLALANREVEGAHRKLQGFGTGSCV